MVTAVSLVTGCSDPPTTIDARQGTLTLRLTTPNLDDGAIEFSVTGPPINSAVAVTASLRLFTRRVDDSTMVGVVVGDVANGALVTLQVPDVGAAAAYRARAIEVADRQDVLRESLTGYALTVAP